MRLVKFVPAAPKPPIVIPAPKISSPAAVVVTDPLLADALLPEAEAVASSGFGRIFPVDRGSAPTCSLSDQH